MRNYTLITSMKKCLLALAIGVVAVSGCKKDKEDNTPKYSKIMFVNAIPDSGPFDFYIDNTKKTGNIAFGIATDYFQVNAASHLISVTNLNDKTSKIEFSQNFENNKSYSIYAINTIAQPTYAVLTDTLSSPPASQVWIRYVNLTTNVKAFIEGAGGSFEFKAQPFKGYSGYKVYDTDAVDFVVKDPDAGVIYDPAPLSVQRGKVYTLVLYGSAPNYKLSAFTKP